MKTTNEYPRGLWYHSGVSIQGPVWGLFYELSSLLVRGRGVTLAIRSQLPPLSLAGAR
jgi:hypothetical protein